MNTRVVSSALALILICCLSPSAPAEEAEAVAGDDASVGGGFSGEVTFATDYVFRGISQSEEVPAVQGSFGYAHRSGFRAGIWGSNVDRIVSAGGVEIDLSAGYEKRRERLAYSFELIYYAYPGDDAARPESDYVEGAGVFEYLLSEAGLLPTLGVSYFYSPQYYAEGGPGHYAAGSLSLTLPRQFGLDLELGHQDVGDGEVTPGLAWTHWRVAVTKPVAGFELELNYQDTSGLDEDRAVADLADGRFVFLVTRSF